MAKINTLAFWISTYLIVAFSSDWSDAATYSLVIPRNAIRGNPLQAILYTYRPVCKLFFSVTDSKGSILQSLPLIPQADGVTPIRIEVGLNWIEGTYNLKIFSTDYSLNATATFNVIRKTHSILVQTDKAIYKPLQTANIRVLVTTANLKPFSSNITVTIEDPEGHRIIQWINQKLTLGIASFSLPLSDRPRLGNWMIKVAAGDENAVQQFEVSEYVLPRFSVAINLPPYVTPSQSHIFGYVLSVYTYGEAVRGVASITFQLNGKLLNLVFSVTGNQSFDLGPRDLSILGLKDAAYTTLTATVNFTESLTGISASSSTSLYISPFDAQVSFLPATSKYFKKGLTYTAYVKVTHPDGSLLREPNLRLRISAYYNTFNFVTSLKRRISSYVSTVQTIYNASVTVPQYGIVAVTLPVPDNTTDSFTISAQLLYRGQAIEATHYVSSFAVIGSNNIAVRLVGSAESLQSGDYVTLSVTLVKPALAYYYLAIARGRIVSYGRQRGTARTFSLVLTAQHAPQTTFLVYVVGPDNEIVADSLTVNVAGAFSNKVALEFKDGQGRAVSQAKPGDNLSLHVQSDPWSVVGLLSVDQSVLLLKGGNDITQEQLSKELLSYKPDYSDGGPFFFDFFWPRWGGSSTEQIFTAAGFTIVTDATIARERFFRFDKAGVRGAVGAPGIKEPLGPVAVEKSASAGSSTGSQVRTRKLFPETWIWELLHLNASGKGSVSVSAPDTITSWVTTAFSMNAQSGLAVTPIANKFKVFQNFFVSAILPYSVIRGEEVNVNIVVFNYMETAQVVRVTLLASSSFVARIDGTATFSQGKDLSYTVTVPAESGANVHFWIVPRVLGLIKISVGAQAPGGADRIENSLLVKPEGIQQSYCLTDLVTLLRIGRYNHTFTVQYPAYVVTGSSNIDIRVSGDIMAPSIEGLDNLVQVPNGCGEQNMITFTPNIFVREYLEAIGRLDPVLTSRTQRNMLLGYQGELTYLRKDGLFSAFGDSDTQGSTWLTAFVVKSFRQAQRYINSSIDENVLSNARNKLIHDRYLRNGTFIENGRVIHVDMQGGSGSGLPLTAYVVIAMLEDNLQAPTEVRSLSAAVRLLEDSLASISNDSYSLAIVTYALQLAGSSKVTQAVYLLEKQAIVSGDTIHWSKAASNQPATTCYACPRPDGASAIEMTSYALLIYVRRGDLVKGAGIAKWLANLRSNQGGFTSTQDTVLALQALASYSRLVRPAHFSLDISFAASNGDILRDVIITSENSLVQQVTTVKHPDTLKTLMFSAVGQGSAIVTVCVSYNVFNVFAVPAVDVSVSVTPATASSTYARVKVCARSSKPRGIRGGMGIIEIQLPSGFLVDNGGVNSPKVRRVDYQQTLVVLYFDEFNESWTCALVLMQQSFRVNSVKDAYVRAYDYYNPGQYKIVAYNPFSGTGIPSTA